MKKAVRMAVAAGMCAALALSAGCQKKTVADDEVQRYAWPLATASPEDTVTQIYAEKFAEEVEELSDGMKVTCGAVFWITNGMSPSLQLSRSSLSPPIVPFG